MTNFLEQLAAEYYSHMDYFVRTNVKYGLRKKGGYEGEMDVVAFHSESLTLLHIETSMDADSCEKRKSKFQKKFSTAHEYYHRLFKFEIKKIEKMVVVGFSPPREDFWSVAPIKSIPDFIGEVAEYVEQFHPINHAVSENYPLLRAIQFTTHYDNRLRKL